MKIWNRLKALWNFSKIADGRKDDYHLDVILNIQERLEAVEENLLEIRAWVNIQKKEFY